MGKCPMPGPSSSATRPSGGGRSIPGEAREDVPSRGEIGTSGSWIAPEANSSSNAIVLSCGCDEAVAMDGRAWPFGSGCPCPSASGRGRCTDLAAGAETSSWIWPSSRTCSWSV
eukprot:scaffold26749_cov27-Tisochrysis_lutea.AAC.3